YIEELTDIMSVSFVGSHEPYVSIYPRSVFIVIAAGHVHIASHFRPFFSYDQHKFGVRLHTVDPINDETARLLQPLGFSYVIFFIETCFYLKKHRYMLAIFGSFYQGIGDAAIVCQAVNG